MPWAWRKAVVGELLGVTGADLLAGRSDLFAGVGVDQGELQGSCTCVRDVVGRTRRTAIDMSESRRWLRRRETRQKLGGAVMMQEGRWRKYGLGLHLLGGEARRDGKLKRPVVRCALSGRA